MTDLQSGRDTGHLAGRSPSLGREICPPMEDVESLYSYEMVEDLKRWMDRLWSRFRRRGGKGDATLRGPLTGGVEHNSSKV